MRTFRTFIALEIPDQVQHRLAALQDELRQHDERVSWTRPENIHLTLKFLGEVEAARLQRVQDGLETIALGAARFSFRVQHLGAFPSLRRARVLWAGVEAGPQLAALAKKIDDTLIPLGFSKENRRFTPHLTLGRVKASLGRDFMHTFDHLSFDGGQVEAREVVLFKSDLKPGGAVYTPLARFPLGNERD